MTLPNRNLIIRPAGLGDLLLMGITISSIRKRCPLDIFDVVVLEDYRDVANKFLDIQKVYTVPSFYYHGGNPGVELFKRYQREFGKEYDNVLNWQDSQIERFKNKNKIPRVDLFLANSPYSSSGVDVNIEYVRLREVTPLLQQGCVKRRVGVCMTSVSFYRSFDERIIIETIEGLLSKGFEVHHFGFRFISQKNLCHSNFYDYGSKLNPLELWGLIKSMDFVVTVDTAAFHFATLCKVPYLAFFGEVNERLRTSHLKGAINGKIVCNNELECVDGECVFCDKRPCLNDYGSDFILRNVILDNGNKN